MGQIDNPDLSTYSVLLNVVSYSLYSVPAIFFLLFRSATGRDFGLMYQLHGTDHLGITLAVAGVTEAEAGF